MGRVFRGANHCRPWVSFRASTHSSQRRAALFGLVMDAWIDYIRELISLTRVTLAWPPLFACQIWHPMHGTPAACLTYLQFCTAFFLSLVYPLFPRVGKKACSIMYSLLNFGFVLLWREHLLHALELVS